MLDNCSNLSVLRRSIADKLDMSGSKISLDLSVTGGSTVTFKNQRKVRFRLSSIDDAYTTDFLVEAATVPTVSAQFERIVADPAEFEYLRHLTWTEPLPMSQNYYGCESSIDLLLGLPFQTLIRKPPYFILGPLGSPSAIITELGNCLSVDNLQENNIQRNTTYFCRNCEQDVPFLLDWLRLDSIGIEDPSLNNHLTYNELKADQILDQNTIYLESTNQYQTCLPWIGEPIEVTNTNRALAAASRFAKKYMSDDRKWSEMSERINAMWKNGFIEPVPNDDLRKTENYHYIIAFPVWKYSSVTHSCRIVFQANQKMPEINRSLNSHFLTGKNNLPEIPQLLMKFRTHEFAAVTDVSAMFNRFLLKKEDADFLRFFVALKRPKSKSEKVELLSFRNRCLPFGLSCSPYVATYILQKHASKYLDTPYHKAAEFIISSTYMDDCSFGAENVSEMKKLVSDVKYIFDECSLPTHKYFSNCSEALKSLNPDLCSNQEETSVLGTIWNSAKDTLSFNSFATPTNMTPEMNIEEDILEEAVPKTEEEIDRTVYTKRMLASIIAKVYDINGFISPYLLTAKKLLQQSWMLKIDWDEDLPAEILGPFREFAKELPNLKYIQIPRRIVPKNGKIVELCVFNDACTSSFATAIYAVSVDDLGKRHSNLIFSKSKVKPLNKHFSNMSEDLSIPRMELAGCDIGSRAGNYCKKAFVEINPNIRIRYFTDSLVCLYRIHNDNPGQYKPWVANRLISIRKITENSDWFYVPGELNFSADLASRGGPLRDFIDKQEWLEGPNFIKDNDHQYVTVDMLKLSQAQKQIDSTEKKVVQPTFHHTLVSHQVRVIDQSHLGLEAVILASKSKMLKFYEEKNKGDPSKNGLLFKNSSWQKIVRILGWVLRFVHRCQNRVKTRKKLEKMKKSSDNYQHKLRSRSKQKKSTNVKMPKLKLVSEQEIDYTVLRLSSHEQILSEDMLLRYSQFSQFSKEISLLRNGKDLEPNDILYKLMPVWSDDKFLRMSGRTPNSNLIILPRNHRVSDLYVLHIHLKFNHANVSHTMFQVNQRCHVVGGRQYIKKVLLCCSCRQPIKLYQRMSTLPPINYLDPAKHHYYVQIDYAGHFFIVDENGALSKTWCVIFTCLVTRSVTVKLLKSCTTSDLILGIRSYIAQKGAWQLAVSDAAANFHKASKDLKQILASINWSEVTDSVLKLGMEWRRNVPLSPHRSGAVESMVKLVKVGLDKAIKNKYLNFIQLSVVFDEITAVINSRPLGYVASTSGNDQELMVSPNILCYGRNTDILPTPVKLEDVPNLSNTELQKIYHAHKTKLSVFWKTYFDVYFNYLKFTKKWFKKLNFDVKPGTFILVKEPNLKKFEYKTGRVLSSIRSKDGLVRTLEIKFARNKNPVLRDIKNCSLLEHDFLKLSNDNHECLYSNQTCLLSSEHLDALIHEKSCNRAKEEKKAVVKKQSPP